MADRELVALVEGTPQLVAPTASDTATIAGALEVAGTLASGALTATGSGSFTTGVTLASSSGNVGIGIAHGSADGKFHVFAGSANATADASANTGIFESTGGGGITILTDGSSSSKLILGSNTVNRGVELVWRHSSGNATLQCRKIGGIFDFLADNSVQNLRLAGALGSQTAVFSGTVTAGGLLFKSATDSITAGTTQTQAGATALTTDTNRIAVCANIADVVGLPSAIVGASCKIIHDGAQNAGVFPKISGNSIDGEAANAVDPNALVAGTTRVYACVTTGTWETAS